MGKFPATLQPLRNASFAVRIWSILSKNMWRVMKSCMIQLFYPLEVSRFLNFCMTNVCLSGLHAVLQGPDITDNNPNKPLRSSQSTPLILRSDGFPLAGFWSTLTPKQWLLRKLLTLRPNNNKKFNQIVHLQLMSHLWIPFELWHFCSYHFRKAQSKWNHLLEIISVLYLTWGYCTKTK